MNALVLINKPIGLRSSQCVGIVRKYFGGLKVGHAGTLDSTASGLLVILAGQATRLCEYVMSLPKTYRVAIQFGAETDSADYSGEIVSNKGYDALDVKALYDSLYGFEGWRLQTPPPVSAVKIDGVPAYKLARAGKNPDMKAREVFFRKIDVITPYDNTTGILELEVRCSRGTYIRSLAQDLGKITGCGAYVKSLVRSAIGTFTLDAAESPDAEDFTPVSLTELAKNYTRIHVGAKDAKSFTNGMSILLGNALRTHKGTALLKNELCVDGNEFIGFGKYVGYDYVQPVITVPK